jgi:hypothetical protein
MKAQLRTPLEIGISDSIKSYGNACGGDWTKMILSTIANIPSPKELLNDPSKEWTYEEAYNLLDSYLENLTGFYRVPDSLYWEWRKCTSVAAMAAIAGCELSEVDYSLYYPPHN